MLFAGDAAHIHSPLGGQGLNLGIQDAFNLGWKLAAQVQCRASAGLLDSYHTERHPAAARVLHHTRAQRVLADRRPTGDIAALRDIVIDLARLPDANRYLAGMISGLDVCYPMPGDDHPLLGARMPDIDLVVDGVATRLSALMHTGRGLLLDVTGNDYLTGPPTATTASSTCAAPRRPSISTSPRPYCGPTATSAGSPRQRNGAIRPARTSTLPSSSGLSRMSRNVGRARPLDKACRRGKHDGESTHERKK